MVQFVLSFQRNNSVCVNIWYILIFFSDDLNGIEVVLLIIIAFILWCLQFHIFSICILMLCYYIFAKHGNDMESQNMSQNTVQCKSWDGGTRRTWTFNEEHCLINHFKDLVSQWWKCDNGFKSRCLAQLEQAMAKLFMGTNIKGEPQIH